MPNFNPETGIAYGIVALHSLAGWVFDEFWNSGTDLTSLEIEREALAENPEWEGELPEGFWDSIETDESCYELEAGGMKLGLSYLGGAPLVWVYFSPHTTTCRPCSPCIPGGGDLDSPDELGMEAYTLPAEWFEGGES